MHWVFIAVILGLVEGATEFVPVSSTGHLIVASDWLGYVGDQADTFVIFIQLGAILAIVWLYRATLVENVRGWNREPGWRFFTNLAIAFLPAAIAGLLFSGAIKTYLFNPLTVAGALIVGGIVILVIERWQPPTRVATVEAIPWRLALGVGLAQVLALFPGVSRSGATILGGYSLGLSRRAATEFSFFLAIPVMCAATVYDLIGSRDVLSLADLPMFAVGFAVSFVSALVVVRRFVTFVSGHTFAWFAWYRILFGLVVLAVYFS
ncbi:MAG: undecaprenyl-diphosphate phosphatase [Vicinamibacterales bacterium]|nr:undecaprenyl-diphosphate phosphatase [Vicinamibacterales bacterium]